MTAFRLLFVPSGRNIPASLVVTCPTETDYSARCKFIMVEMIIGGEMCIFRVLP